MFKVVITFLIFWAVVTGVYSGFKGLTSSGKLDVLKVIWVGAVTAFVATAILVGIVVLF